jgi:dolichol-phosphate hexosyltransferase
MKDTLGEISVLVIDGKSNDRTVEIARNMGAKVVCHNGFGKGSAIAKGLECIDSKVDYVIFTDADYTYPAKYVPAMIKILEENPFIGMVSGNRFTGHVDSKAIPSIFYIGNKLLALAHKVLNGVTLQDPFSGLRVIRTKALRGWFVKSEGFDIEVELNHHVKRQGFRIWEIPISYRARLGEKKLKASDGVTILKRILLETVF